MTIAVCITSYRSQEDVALCLEALAAQTHADFDVVICENGGAAATAATRAALPTALPGGQRVEVIDGGGNIGYAGGCNVGMAARPDASAWWILNPDAEPAPGAMAAMVSRLAQGDVQGVGSVLHFEDGRIQGVGGRWTAWAARTVSIGYGTPVERMPPVGEVERDQNYLLGASMLIGRRFLELAGPMREDYFLYCEEVEWCLRAIERGVRLGFAPDARVMHRQGAVTGSGHGARQRPKLPVYLEERNRMNLIRDTKPWLMPVAIVPQVTRILWRFARKGAWQQTGYGLSGMIAGLRNERGQPAWLGAK